MTAMQDLAQGRAKAKESPLTAARRLSFGRAHLRGLAAVVVFVLIWQVGANTGLLGRGSLASPLESFRVFVQDYLGRPGYWEGWLVSVQRVLAGFLIAQVIGIPLGILFGISRRARQIVFPVFEILRPIPPLAWVPLSILFWPTAESSIVFITTLGAFFIIVINVFDGVRTVPGTYVWQARALGAGGWTIVRRIYLPALMPAIAAGMTLGITVTWNVLIAAEMIASDSGLGRLTWEGYVSGASAVVIIGMVSIGIAGALSSLAIGWLERRLTPWAREARGRNSGSGR